MTDERIEELLGKTGLGRQCVTDGPACFGGPGSGRQASGYGRKPDRSPRLAAAPPGGAHLPPIKDHAAPLVTPPVQTPGGAGGPVAAPPNLAPGAEQAAQKTASAVAAAQAKSNALALKGRTAQAEKHNKQIQNLNAKGAKKQSALAAKGQASQTKAAVAAAYRDAKAGQYFTPPGSATKAAMSDVILWDGELQIRSTVMMSVRGLGPCLEKYVREVPAVFGGGIGGDSGGGAIGGDSTGGGSTGGSPTGGAPHVAIHIAAPASAAAPKIAAPKAAPAPPPAAAPASPPPAQPMSLPTGGSPVKAGGAGGPAPAPPAMPVQTPGGAGGPVPPPPSVAVKQPLAAPPPQAMPIQTPGGAGGPVPPQGLPVKSPGGAGGPVPPMPGPTPPVQTPGGAGGPVSPPGIAPNQPAAARPPLPPVTPGGAGGPVPPMPGSGTPTPPVQPKTPGGAGGPVPPPGGAGGPVPPHTPAGTPTPPVQYTPAQGARQEAISSKTAEVSDTAYAKASTLQVEAQAATNPEQQAELMAQADEYTKEAQNVLANGAKQLAALAKQAGKNNKANLSKSSTKPDERILFKQANKQSQPHVAIHIHAPGDGSDTIPTSPNVPPSTAIASDGQPHATGEQHEEPYLQDQQDHVAIATQAAKDAVGYAKKAISAGHPYSHQTDHAIPEQTGLATEPAKMSEARMAKLLGMSSLGGAMLFNDRRASG